MLRLLTTALGLLLVLGIVAEIMAPRMLEAGVEEVVHERSRGAAVVEADAGSFPFVPELAGEGVIDRLTVTLEEVGGGRVPLSRVAFTLEDIHVDRGALLGGDVEVTDIGAGLVTVDLERRRLAEALGGPLDLDPGMIELAGRALRIAVDDGGAVELPVPRELLPCAPEMEVTGERVRLRCRLEEVPEVLVRAAQG